MHKSQAPLSPTSSSPLSTPAPASARSAFQPVKLHTVKGGGGVELCVAEAGNPEGPAILFVHGFNQSLASWRLQLESALGLDFRMVALDLRGHGRSGKPEGAYADSLPWAEDLHAVITTLRLQRPVLVGWSYGGVVLTDYVRHFGQENVAGLNFVGALTRLGKREFFADFGGGFLQVLPGLLSEDAGASQHAVETFLSLLSHRPLEPRMREEVLAFNLAVPRHVREGIGQRVEDGDDVLRALKVPVLASHGQEDRVILPRTSHHTVSLARGAEVSLYPDVGHSPFCEDVTRFNQELARFVARCQ